MKIKLKHVYIGNIEKITETDIKSSLLPLSSEIYSNKGNTIKSDLYKENACLIKVDNGLFIDIDNIKTIIGKRKLNKAVKHIINKKAVMLGKFIMDTTGFFKDELIVKSDTVKKAFPDLNQQKKMSLKKIKNKINNQNISK